MDADGAQIILGSGAFGALCGVVTAWIKARFSKTTVEPQPLPVKLEEKFAPKEGNAEAHREIFLRLSAAEQGLAAVKAEVGMIKAALDRLENKSDRILALLSQRSAPAPNLPQ